MAPALGAPAAGGLGSAGGDKGGGATAPTWATPGRLLALFCTMCLFIYLDRGMIASNGVNGSAASAAQPGSGIQGDFKLSLFQDGLLPAAFMVGLLVSSPVFAEASKRHNAFRLIGTGLAVWTAAAAGCGLAPGFIPLLLCRMAVGVGEASFVALAAPFIDDNAPAERKTLWLGFFYCCIPTGYALGYIVGGLVGGALGWRAAFLLEAAAMLPFVLFCLRAPPISLRGGSRQQHQPRHEEHGARGAVRAVAADLALLWRHPVYVWNVLGSTVYTAVLGSFAFYGPKAGRDVFGIPPERADLTFGAITVLTGTLGTLAGGSLLDRIGSSLRNALLLCTTGITAGSLLSVAAFWGAGSFSAFALVFAAAELAMFMSQAPSSAVCMWSVPATLRPFAMSMSVVTIHVLGDVPSPPLLGVLQGWLQDWRASMSIASSLLLLGSAAYFVGALIAARAVDYRELAAACQPIDSEAALSRPSSSVDGTAAEADEEGGGRPASPDRPLLPSAAPRSG